MELDKVKSMKIQLEEGILALIGCFEYETGLKVDTININRIRIESMFGKSHILEIKAEVKL